MFTRLGPGCSNGNVRKRVETGGFIMSEVGYDSGSRLTEHAHENAHFCFVIRGTYTETHGRQEIACRPSTVTFRPAGEAHEDRFDQDDVEVVTLEVPPSWTERLSQESIALRHSLTFQGGSVPWLADRLVSEFRRMDAGARLVMEGIALEMIAESARHTATTERSLPEWLAKARELLHARFSERLTLDDIASEVGVHPVHLATVFRKKYDRTVGEYVRERRIDYARRELVSGTTPLATIALDAGFANQGHFSSTFKQITGFTPAAYRRSFARRLNRPQTA
jgi:AraC family transcriptional regulator